MTEIKNKIFIVIDVSKYKLDIFNSSTGEIKEIVLRSLVVTFSSFTLAAILSVGIVSESWAVTCTFTEDPNNPNIYVFSATGTTNDTEFSTSSCDGQYPNGINGWEDMKKRITTAELPFAKKKRWTPAEATQWLNEDDNTVTITFKR